MEPVIALVLTFLLLRLAGCLRMRRSSSPVIALRIAFAVMFLMTAYTRLFHPVRTDLLVTLTGLAEIAGAIGLLFRRSARWAAAALAVLLLALLPTNIHRPIAAHVLLQCLLVAGVLMAGFGARTHRRWAPT